MKTVIKGKKTNVNYELGYNNSGEPFIKENKEILGDAEVKVLDNDITFSKGEEIYFDENTSATVISVKKTLDGTTYIYTDYQVEEDDKDEKDFVQKLYDRAYEKYSKDLLKRYPNVSNVLKLMGKDNLSSKEIVAAVKSFNGLQNDFFMK